MVHTTPIRGWRSTLMKLVWLPFSLIWGTVAILGMSVLELVLRQEQQVRPDPGLHRRILSACYWVLSMLFTGERPLPSNQATSAKA